MQLYINLCNYECMTECAMNGVGRFSNSNYTYNTYILYNKCQIIFATINNYPNRYGIGGCNA